MQQQNLDLKLPPPPYPTPSNGGATPAPKLQVHLKIIRLISVWVQTHSAFFVVRSHGDTKINTFFIIYAFVLPSSSSNNTIKAGGSTKRAQNVGLDWSGWMDGWIPLRLL